MNEEKVLFISSIVLGLNDGLIEITGALVGFVFALGSNSLVVITGFITGLAGSMSMSASAYLQAKYEPGKDAKKAALYTGIAYIIVVFLLLLPFLVMEERFTALLLLGGIILCIISGISYYTAIIFERSFRKQFWQMLLFSMGVAFITFILGSLARYWFGAEGG